MSNEHLSSPEVRAAVVTELRQQADSTIAELVCCDEYERAQAAGYIHEINHEICYWGAAHAAALRWRADQIERIQ